VLSIFIGILVAKKIFICEIKSSNDVIRIRLKERGDEYEEIKRRMKADKRDFADIEEFIDCSIHSDSDFISVEKLANKEEISIYDCNMTRAAEYLLKEIQSEATLKKTYLREAHLERANLAKANLEGVYFQLTDLEWTDLESTNLTNAYLQIANLERVNLTGANLTRTHLEGAQLRKATFDPSILKDAILWNTKISRERYDEIAALGIDVSEIIWCD